MTEKQKEAVQQAKLRIRELEQKIQEFRSTEEFLSFVKAMARFHKYSFNNQLLILSQRPDAAQVAGFRTWKMLGRHVKHGEKGIVIIVPIKVIHHDEEQDEDTMIVTGYSTAHVFDIAQTDGEDLPDISLAMTNHGSMFMSHCMMLAEMMGVKVMTRESMHADGISRGGKVVLRKDDNPTYMAATLLHELAHERLHHGEKMSREQRELEAETVAYIVCDRFGIELPAHKYLATWQKSKSIMDSLKRISECASELIEGLQSVRATSL